jgi:hypothetical protein
MLQNTQNRNDDQYFTTQDVDAFSDHADDLMDDLFGSVENTLHVGATKKRPAQKTPHQILPPFTPSSSIAIRHNNNQSTASSANYHQDSDQAITPHVETPKDTVSITKIDLVDFDLPPVSRQDILWIEPYIAREPSASADPVEPPINFTPAKPTSLLDRLLLVGACSSALLAAVMWSMHSGIINVKNPKVSAVPSSSQVPSDKQQFADEIKRSLTSISEKNNRAATNPNVVNGFVVSPLGTNSPIISTMPGGNNGQLQMASPPLVGTTVPPLYVPVYQPPAPNGLTTPTALPPVSSTDGSVVITPSTSNLQPMIAPTATAPGYTLIGLLDLGDRSSAMFDVNGSMQTIGLGKQVGNSGWTLSRISQQEVSLRRGNESKNVFIGQKFN